jgi:pimeloyl-ACP methyl ester carboxylesterase
VKLAYLDLPGEGVPAVALHREATLPTAPVALVQATGVVGRTVAPIGDYAFYPSGMAIGGLCWYRIMPGFSGTDPISLAKAVVQVVDLLDDLDLERPLLAGFGQGAIVALGTGMLRPDRVGRVVAVDPHAAHVALLPAAVFEVVAPPPILLAASTPDRGAELERTKDVLAGFARSADSWCAESGGAPEAVDAALAEAVRDWLAAGGGAG